MLKEDTTSAAQPQAQLPSIHVRIDEICKFPHLFDISPPFQRGDSGDQNTVWPKVRRQLLINTIFSGDNIPALEAYMVRNADGVETTVFLDGHQRIAAILGFYRNEYRTISDAQKKRVHLYSIKAKEPKKFFSELDPVAQSIFLNYRITINYTRNMTPQETVIRYQDLNSGVPISAAEGLKACTYIASKTGELAKEIKKHPFWNEFYIGRIDREQPLQSSLHCIALEMAPDIHIDLESSSYMQRLASGMYDAALTEQVEQNILKRLNMLTHVYHGTTFTARGTIIAMWQGLRYLERAGVDPFALPKGCLKPWLQPIIDDSRKHRGLPNYMQPVQRLLKKKVQVEFWNLQLPRMLSFVNA